MQTVVVDHGYGRVAYVQGTAIIGRRVKFKLASHSYVNITLVANSKILGSRDHRQIEPRGYSVACRGLRT